MQERRGCPGSMHRDRGSWNRDGQADKEDRGVDLAWRGTHPRRSDRMHRACLHGRRRDGYMQGRLLSLLPIRFFSFPLMARGSVSFLHALLPTLPSALIRLPRFFRCSINVFRFVPQRKSRNILDLTENHNDIVSDKYSLRPRKNIILAF